MLAARARASSRMASRSRGPPRPSESRESARSRSGQPLSGACAGRRAAAAASTSAWTASSRRRIGSGCASGAARRAASRRPPAPVTVRSIAAEQAALALAREAAQQLEIAPRRGVDQHVAAGHHPPRRRQMRQAALLGQLDIADQRAAGAKLGAREGAEAVERRDPEARLQAALAGQRIRTRDRAAASGGPASRATGGAAPAASSRRSGSSSSPGSIRASSAARRCSLATGPVRKVAGRDVEPGERQRLLALGERGEEVVRGAPRAGCPRSACRA